MTLSRRGFLTASSGVAFGAALPGVFQRTALAAPPVSRSGAKETVLVVVELTGGNDGLNTVIPCRDPEYARARPKLKQPVGKVKKINLDLAFHPAMSGFATLWEKSKLAIVQGVGYPNSNRSHFASMDIWHTASRSKQQKYGWLGRGLKHLGGSGAAMHVGGNKGSLALFSATGHAPSLKSLADYRLHVGQGKNAAQKLKLIENFAESQSGSASENDLLNLVRRSAQETYKSSRRIQKVAKSGSTSSAYPQTGLGKRLQLIAKLIRAEVPERVYYTSLGGFDTHAAQAGLHTNLLTELSGALNAFQQDMSKHGLGKRVTVMTFSEFGRRVRENGSAGTDHGSASQMFLIGDAIRPGVIGKHPSLRDLVRGDLKHHTDFRSVYATVLDDWLGLPADKILAGKHPRLPLFAKKT